jgi:hypothetical protein
MIGPDLVVVAVQELFVLTAVGAAEKELRLS